MQNLAELSICERGILASAAAIEYVDEFSNRSRHPIADHPVFRRPLIQSRTYMSRGKLFAIEWQDFGQALPVWFNAVMQGLVDLLTLPAGWSSYKASEIDPAIVARVIELSNDLIPEFAPAPAVVPLSSGGLQLEWHKSRGDLELIFDRGETPYFSYRNTASEEELEGEIAGKEPLLKSLISNLG